MKTGDRVKETTTSTGTGNLTLAGAVVGFVTFLTKFGAGITPGISVCIHDPGTGDWEVSKCSYNGGTLVLTRSTVEFSSNANALVNFAAGTKNVFCTISATDIEAAALTTPAGGNKEIQYNNAGVLAGDSLITRSSSGSLVAYRLAAQVINIVGGGWLTDDVGKFSFNTVDKKFQVERDWLFTFSSMVDDWFTGVDVGFKRNAAGVIEINDGVNPATFRDLILRYLTLNGSLRFIGQTSTAANPTTTELPNDKDLAIHRNTATAAVYLAYNDAGTIKKVQLT